MDAAERTAIASLQGTVAARIAAEGASPWNARRIAAGELLAAVNHAWRTVHARDPAAYERDLGRLNTLAGWPRGDHAQVAAWRSSQGETLLMPPKFFGGDPLALDERFVASISLNHAVLKDDTFCVELRDQQSEIECLSAHREYFARDYAYKRFFVPRALVLHAYASRAGRANVPALEDWRALNRSFGFYIEAFPTRSRKFKTAQPSAAPAVLAREVFVCGLNAIVHDVVLHLLRPQRVLLAGRSTWDVWPDPELTSHGTKVTLRAATAFPCPVFR